MEEITSCWDENTSGGCLNHPSWRSNPQFELSLPTAGAVRVELRQLGAGLPTGIGLYVALARADGLPRVTLPRSALVAKSAFAETPSIVVEATAGVEGLRWVLIPSTFLPGVSREFVLAVGAPGGARLRALPPTWRPLRASGRLRAGSPAPVFHDEADPQLRLSLPKAPALVTLAVPRASAALAAAPVALAASFRLSEAPRALRRAAGSKEAALELPAGEWVLAPALGGSGDTSGETEQAVGDLSFELLVWTADEGAELRDLPKGVVDDGARVTVEWDARGSGGTLTRASWRANPQFALKVRGAGLYALRLELEEGSDEGVGSGGENKKKDHDDGGVVGDKNAEGDEGIALYLLTGTGARRFGFAPADLLASGFARARVELRCFLAPSQHPFALVCALTRVGARGSGVLRVVRAPSAPPPALAPAGAWAHVALPARWAPGRDGGRRGGARPWLENPSFRLTCAAAGAVEVVLEVGKMADGAYPAVGVYVVAEKPPLVGREKAVKPVAKSPFARQREVAVTLFAPCPASYTIVVCTYDEKVHHPFVLHFFAMEGSPKFSVVPSDEG